MSRSYVLVVRVAVLAGFMTGLALLSDESSGQEPKAKPFADPEAAFKLADTNKEEIIAFTPLQVRWFTPSYYTDGRERAQLLGDSSQGGAWVDRVKMPAGREIFEALGAVFLRHRGDRRVSFEMEVPQGTSSGKPLRVRADVSTQIRVHPSATLIAEVEQIVGLGAVSLR